MTLDDILLKSLHYGFLDHLLLILILQVNDLEVFLFLIELEVESEHNVLMWPIEGNLILFELPCCQV